jgi:cytochrome P450
MTTTDVEQLGSIFADAAAYADPASWHAAAARIRAEEPILRVSVPDFPEFWAITKHDDVMEIERLPAQFTNAPVPTLAPSDRVAKMSETPVQTLIQMDGDKHKAHRNIVNDWFKAGNVKRMQERVDTLAKQSVDRMVELDGECDFVNDVALHYPLQVILSILGLPADDYPRMLQLTQELFGAEDPDIGRMADDPAGLNVLLDFVNYFTRLAQQRREVPTEDLASVIANARIDGELLPDLDMLGHCVIIATAATTPRPARSPAGCWR